MRFGRINIEHQAMTEFARRRHREYLRLYFGLEIEHHANDIRAIDADPDRLHIRIADANFGGELL